MPRNNARFIVFEGLDGAGTTTQAARLHDHFTHGGAKGFLTNEPTPEPIGAFIRRLLTSKEPDRDGRPYRGPGRDRSTDTQPLSRDLLRASCVETLRGLVDSVRVAQEMFAETEKGG